MRELGIIGLGRMGANIARHLVEQKIRTVVWNRSPEPRIPRIAVA